MKIAWFQREITPEVGCCLAGYGPEDVSVKKQDDLYMSGLVADDGKDRIAVVSFDLLGLDGWYSRRVRERCAKILGIGPEAVLFTCTHTHLGPETRTRSDGKGQINTAYLAMLEEALAEEFENLADFRACDVYFYSRKIDENRNRRYVTGCNEASFTPYRHEVVPIAEEYADKEFGELVFTEPGTRTPIYVIGNYAAHPLAGHAPGIGGLRISADFPGVFRNYVTEETGAGCMYISGASGDLVPKGDELGMKAVEETGYALGKAAVGGILDSTRNAGRFLLKEAKVGAVSKTVRVPFRRSMAKRRPHAYDGMDAVDLEIQVVSIGDICLIGVPGELVCELGQEMKWHSPFRRAFIAYNSTGYMSYLCSVNMVIAGGYEGKSQYMTSRCGLMLVNTAVDAMFELRERLYPQEDGDCYPDNVVSALVNIPANN